MKKHYFKKVFLGIVLLLVLVFGFNSTSFAATNYGFVEKGFYRLNCANYNEYIALISTRSFYSDTFNSSYAFNLYDVNSDLIIPASMQIPADTVYGFGYDSQLNNYASWFVFENHSSVSWHYYAGSRENSDLDVMPNWYYIEFLEDIEDWPLSSWLRFFGSTDTMPPFLVKTNLETDTPGNVNPTFPTTIPSGDYKINFNYNWPYDEDATFIGDIRIYNQSRIYNRISFSHDEIKLYDDSNGISYTIYTNGFWLIRDPSFLAITDIELYDYVDSAYVNFYKNVNGFTDESNGFKLLDRIYIFKTSLNSVTSFISNADDFLLDNGFDIGLISPTHFNYFRYYLDSQELYYYGTYEGTNFSAKVYSESSGWLSENYRYFYSPGLVENYLIASFLYNNLEVYGMSNSAVPVGGYYYFNNSITLADLNMVNDLSNFSIVFNGAIYNDFVYELEINTNSNGTEYNSYTLSYYNTNSKLRTYLVNDPVQNANTVLPTIEKSRQIYISKTLVDTQTYDWLMRNGVFAYVAMEDVEISDLFLLFPDVITHFFASILNFDFFGINLWYGVSSLLTVLVVVWLIRKLL